MLPKVSGRPFLSVTAESKHGLRKEIVLQLMPLIFGNYENELKDRAENKVKKPGIIATIKFCESP